MHIQSLTRVVCLLGVIVVAPAGAYSRHQLDAAAMLVVKSPEDIVQLAQRKGTRNYEGVASGYTTTNTLESCMETWDPGTHITKKRWREICKRQIKEHETAQER